MSGASRFRSNKSPEYIELVGVLTRSGPGGAMVLGGSGVGKFSLVQAAMARPEIAPPVLRLHCSTTLASVPYGALSPYLSTLERVEDPVQVLREISLILEKGRTGKIPPSVVVEDAQFLDPESSFVLSMLVENSAIKLIAIGSGRIDGESTLFQLTDSGLLSTIVVQPLDLEGVSDLAATLTGGRLAESAVEVTRSMTGGNPSLVEAFVQSCLDQGVLVRDQDASSDGTGTSGPWILARLSPEPDDGLIEVVREIHSFLPPGQQRTLEMLALGGPQPRTLLVACGGSDYRHLLESGLLVDDREGVVRFGADIHGLVLRHLVAPGRSAQLHAAWDAHRRDLRLELAPQHVLWSLEVRAEVPAEQVVEAIEAANDELDYPMAWKLCAFSGGGPGSERGLLAECRTLVGVGRFYSARAKLTALAENTDDPSILQRALNMLILVFERLRLDSSETDQVETLWQTRARASGNQAGFARAAEAHAQAAEVLQLWRTVERAESGKRPKVEAERILAQPALSAEGRIVTLMVLSDLHSKEGKTETALDLARQAMAEMDQNASLKETYHLQLLMRIGWNLAFSGRYAEAEEFASQRRGSTARLLLDRHGTLAFIRGVSRLLQGHDDQACAILSEVKAEFRLRDPSRHLLAVMFHEFALGRCPVAERSFSGPLTASPAAPGNQQAGTATLGTPEADTSRRMLRRVATAGNAGPGHELLREFPMIERELIFFSAARLQPTTGTVPDLNGRLAGLVSGMEGPRAGLLGSLATAHLRDGTADEMMQISREAVEAEEYRIAVEAMAKAANLYSAAGDNRNCGMVLRELSELLREQQLTAGSYATRALAMAELTSREEEIVELARDGLNNAKIAETLTVSQRTVEGHLYRVFSKLGINDRSELLGLRSFAGTSRSQNA